MKKEIINEVIEEMEIIEESIEPSESSELALKDNSKLEVKREVLDWDKMMAMADFLSKSTIIPVAYQNYPENILVALDLASRMGVSPMMVMQNLFIIQGKPSFSGQAIASMIRTNPTLKNVTLNFVGKEGQDTWGAYVSATRVSDGRELKGATVTIGTAKAEGWMQKTGSKWKTLPELMLTYRAYAWFGRAYLPEAFMGLHATDELEDMETKKTDVENPFEKGGK